MTLDLQSVNSMGVALLNIPSYVPIRRAALGIVELRRLVSLQVTNCDSGPTWANALS